MKKFEKWVSTSTYPLIDPFTTFSTKKVKKDIDIDKKSVIKFINDYKKKEIEGRYLINKNIASKDNNYKNENGLFYLF
jgi:hypothetical protein